MEGERMKTAIYIEDGVTQLVLTPESEFERNAMKSFSGKSIETQLFNGSFYDCRGGWVRQSAYRDSGYGQQDDRSIIIRMAPVKPVEVSA